jgi:hypothetical protein
MKSTTSSTQSYTILVHGGAWAMDDTIARGNPWLETGVLKLFALIKQ